MWCIWFMWFMWFWFGLGFDKAVELVTLGTGQARVQMEITCQPQNPPLCADVRLSDQQSTIGRQQSLGSSVYYRCMLGSSTSSI
jgi:hypothetical protein